MRSTRDWLSGQRWTKAFQAVGLITLSLYASLAFAQADINGFTGDFATNYWTATPDAGAIYFTNGNSELVLSGPHEPSTPTSSIDPITYNGPLPGGLAVGGTVEFSWQYNSPGYSSDDQCSFAWTPAGGSSSQVILAQGPGATNNLFSIQLSAGTTFEFVLFSDTPANKSPASLSITNFQFHGVVPEPSTGTLFSGLAVAMTAVSVWRSRRRGR